MDKLSAVEIKLVSDIDNGSSQLANKKKLHGKVEGLSSVRRRGQLIQGFRQWKMRLKSLGVLILMVNIAMASVCYEF